MPIKGERIEDEGVIEPKVDHKLSVPSQHLAVWFDDFMADAIDTTYWTSGGTAGSFATPSTNTIGGVLEGDTTAGASSTATLTFDEGVFDTTYPFGMEFRLKTSNITNTLITAGFRQDANDYAWFEFDTADSAANIYCAIQNAGGGNVSADSGSDLVADTYNIFRIEVQLDRTVKFYINDNLVEHSAGWPSTTTVATSTTFVPYFYVDNKAEAEQKLLDIDYVKVWQLRDKNSYSYDL